MQFSRVLCSLTLAACACAADTAVWKIAPPPPVSWQRDRVADLAARRKAVMERRIDNRRGNVETRLHRASRTLGAIRVKRVQGRKRPTPIRENVTRRHLGYNGERGWYVLGKQRGGNSGAVYINEGAVGATQRDVQQSVGFQVVHRGFERWRSVLPGKIRHDKLLLHIIILPIQQLHFHIHVPRIGLTIAQVCCRYLRIARTTRIWSECVRVKVESQWKFNGLTRCVSYPKIVSGKIGNSTAIRLLRERTH